MSGARMPGTRRPNHTGTIKRHRLAAGGISYHAALQGKFVGSFESYAAAERGIEAARAGHDHCRHEEADHHGTD